MRPSSPRAAAWSSVRSRASMRSSPIRTRRPQRSPCSRNPGCGRSSSSPRRTRRRRHDRTRRGAPFAGARHREELPRRAGALRRLVRRAGGRSARAARRKRRRQIDADQDRLRGLPARRRRDPRRWARDAFRDPGGRQARRGRHHLPGTVAVSRTDGRREHLLGPRAARPDGQNRLGRHAREGRGASGVARDRRSRRRHDRGLAFGRQPAAGRDPAGAVARRAHPHHGRADGGADRARRRRRLHLAPHGGDLHARRPGHRSARRRLCRVASRGRDQFRRTRADDGRAPDREPVPEGRGCDRRPGPRGAGHRAPADDEDREPHGPRGRDRGSCRPRRLRAQRARADAVRRHPGRIGRNPPGGRSGQDRFARGRAGEGNSLRSRGPGRAGPRARHERSAQFFARRPSDNLLNQGRLMAEIGLIALPMTFVIVTGGIDLSVGVIVGLCAIVLGYSWKNLGFPLPLAIVFALFVGALAGLVNGLVITRIKVPPLIMTIATLALYRGLAEGVSQARSVRGYPDWFYFLGQGDVFGVPAQLLILIVLTVIAGVALDRTTFGRALYAIGANETAARFSALNVDRAKLIIYTLSGLASGLAAFVLVSRVTTTRMDMGLGYELDVIAAVVLGGASIFGGSGTIWGTT